MLASKSLCTLIRPRYINEGWRACFFTALSRSPWTVSGRRFASINSQDPYWYKIPKWRGISAPEFLSYKWQVRNSRSSPNIGQEHGLITAQMSESVHNAGQLLAFMTHVLPETIPRDSRPTQAGIPETKMCAASDFITNVKRGIERSPMSIRLSPHILSLIDWKNPLNDPLRRQFIPLASQMHPDHPRVQLDSLEETADSPVQGLVHRYPHKALFLGES